VHDYETQGIRTKPQFRLYITDILYVKSRCGVSGVRFPQSNVTHRQEEHRSPRQK
jgi:hypothetical protein